MTEAQLPEEYMERMKKLLGEGFAAYEEALNRPRETALRLNPFKCPDAAAREAVRRALPFPSEGVPYDTNGFYFSAEKPGAHPLHHAGAYYVQEPSAMAPLACRADFLPEGGHILDVCAAPGGKSLQAASLFDKPASCGILIANEVVPQRCRTLEGNIERLGLKNAVVMNAGTAFLAAEFPEMFALVVCDAPCSGEGMFRKNPEAVSEWRPGAAAACAARQQAILTDASRCVCEGGSLLYSTCTFSPEENESVVSAFLAAHPAFSLVPPPEKILPFTVGGIPEYCRGFDPDLVRRFYPHTGRGEGQFFAFLRKSGTLRPPQRFACRDTSRALTREEEKAALSFLAENVDTESLPGTLRACGEMISLFPENMRAPGHAFSCGVKLGICRAGRIVPHHQFFSAYGRVFFRTVDLSSDSPECAAYLHGVSFEPSSAPAVPDGWTAVLVNGFPLGGAKSVGGVLKNHYPKGLRTMG